MNILFIAITIINPMYERSLFGESEQCSCNFGCERFALNVFCCVINNHQGEVSTNNTLVVNKI